MVLNPNALKPAVYSKGATALAFECVSFISFHPLCLLGIARIFFISKHHSEMLIWQTNVEAVLSLSGYYSALTAAKQPSHVAKAHQAKEG